jgi:N-acetylmuramoyl-L-alanine amidase
VKVVNHHLHLDDGTRVPFRASPNAGGACTPEFLVMHYTAGASAESSIQWFLDPQARASSHLVIARNGAITQLVPFHRQAWHAGESRWANRTGLNAWSIGIELDNAGELMRAPGGWTTKWGRSIPNAEVIEAVHKNGGPVTGWHTYTVEQLETATYVAAALVAHYGLRDVVGHDDVAPLRKTDPGPAFEMRSFRAAAMGRAHSAPAHDARFVTVRDLNIRVGPGSWYDKLPASPLPVGTRLLRFDGHEVWLRVRALDAPGGDMDLEGWVHGGFVKPDPGRAPRSTASASRRSGRKKSASTRRGR